jgi:PhnB protein
MVATTAKTARHRAAVPFLYYGDVAAAIGWLTETLGFRERFRLAAPNGFVVHAELMLGEAVVMLGNLGPRNAGPPPDRVRSGVYVFVEDVDEHCRVARGAGAEIVEEPSDQPFGDRFYLVRDPEGHEWHVAQHLRDVAVEDLARGLAGGR